MTNRLKKFKDYMIDAKLSGPGAPSASRIFEGHYRLDEPEDEETKKLLDDAQQKLDRTVGWMFVNHSYYAEYLIKFGVYLSDYNDTAFVDYVNIYFNPKFVINNDAPSLRFVLMHEILHVAWLHNVRSKPNPKLWNAAADYAINDWISLDSRFASGKVAFPTAGADGKSIGILHDTKYRGWTADQIYDYLDENPEEIPTQDIEYDVIPPDTKEIPVLRRIKESPMDPEEDEPDVDEDKESGGKVVRRDDDEDSDGQNPPKANPQIGDMVKDANGDKYVITKVNKDYSIEVRPATEDDEPRTV